MTPQFDVGQVVFLKSGGPAMTIMDCQESDCRYFHLCIWMDYQGAMHEARLIDISLRSATPDELDLIEAEAGMDDIETMEQVMRGLTGKPMKD